MAFYQMYFLLGVFAASFATETYVDFRVPAQCGKDVSIGENDVARVLIVEKNDTVGCNMTANAATEKLCYMFDPNAFIKSAGVHIDITNGSTTEAYSVDKQPVPIPVCKDFSTLTITLTLGANYTWHNTTRGFHAIIRVYHSAGLLANAKSIEFAEAVKNVKGYQHGLAYQEHKDQAYLHGLLVGAGLAAMFFVFLIGAICYTRTK